MRLNYHSHYYTSNDIVFSVIFGKRNLFCELVSAVTGDKIELKEDPHSQATLREDDVQLNSIRFDTFATTVNDRLYTADMQRSYKEARLEYRTAYYACRAISYQEVGNMAYENLKPVNIAFILTSHEKDKPIRRIKLCDTETFEIFNDLLEITLVYIQTIVKTADKKSKLYLFARFFAISSQNDADNFVREFEKIKLGKDLIVMYNKAVSNVNKFKKIESSPYFTERLNEAQLEGERKKATEREREKWQGVVAVKDAELAEQGTVISEQVAKLADKDAKLADKDALIAELKKQLGKNK